MNEKIILSLLVIAFCLVIISGCAPIPINRIVYPNIDGKLQNKEEPLVNYKVHFSYNATDACNSKLDSAYQVVKTNLRGEFEIKEMKQWSLFRMVGPADGVAHFNFCFESPSGDRRWFYRSDIRTPDFAAQISLVCEYNKLVREPQILGEKLSFNSAGCYEVK